MKKQFVENLVAFINADNDNDRKELQIKLHHLISSMKFNGGNSEFELTAKNHLLGDIKLYVENPTEANKSLLPHWLTEFPMLIVD